MLRSSGPAKLVDSLAGPPLCALLGGWSAVSRRGRDAGLQRDVSRIVVSKMGNIGDTVLMGPAIKSLRHAFPGARISFVATSRNVEIVKMLPGIDECIFLDHKRCFRDPTYLPRFIRRLRRECFQAAIDFDQWQHLPPVYLYLAGVPVRLGFDTRGERRGALFTRRVPYDEGAEDSGHEVDCYQRLVAALGIPTPDSEPELRVDAEDEAITDTLLRRHGMTPETRIAVVYPTGRSKGGICKTWPAARFVELCERMTQEHGCRLVFVGGADERDVADEIAARVRPEPLVANGLVSLGQLAALLKRATLFVGNDGGPMHVAAAVGAPCVSLHGPTSARRWGPYGVGHVAIEASAPCSPCFFLGAKRRRCVREGACMDSISPAAVEDAVDAIMKRAPAEEVEVASL